jgi:hypothetical protein
MVGKRIILVGLGENCPKRAVTKAARISLKIAWFFAA